ncbi:hypothetical protein [Paenibacillus larvae]
MVNALEASFHAELRK